jgi:hypothetical protein
MGRNVAHTNCKVQTSLTANQPARKQAKQLGRSIHRGRWHNRQCAPVVEVLRAGQVKQELVFGVVMLSLHNQLQGDDAQVVQ